MNRDIRLKIDIVDSRNEMLDYTGFSMNNKSEAIDKFIKYVNKNEKRLWH